MGDYATFTEHPDGSVTVDRFPDEIDVSEQVVMDADPRVLRLDGDRLRIEVANGSAVYAVTGPANERGVFHAARLWSDWRGL